MPGTGLIKTMKQPLFNLLALSLFFTSIAQSQSATHSDGKDFSAWKLVMADDSVPVDQLVAIQDGTLTLYGKRHPKGIIRTKEVYADYELSLEWRWPNDPGNGGLMLHCDPEVTTAAWPKCLEVQLMHNKAGNFRKNGETIEVGPERTTKKPFIQRLITDAENPVGEWNALRVIADGDKVVVYINDQLVNQGEHATTSSGFIALQLELADIQFRSIALKHLSH